MLSHPKVHKLHINNFGGVMLSIHKVWTAAVTIEKKISFAHKQTHLCVCMRVSVTTCETKVCLVYKTYCYVF